MEARASTLLRLAPLAMLGWFGCSDGSRRLDPTAAVEQAAEEAWVGSWAVAPQRGNVSFDQQTLRQIVHPSLSGTKVRIRFSNVFGTEPVELGNVHLAEQVDGAEVDLESDRLVTFGGQSSVTIAAGASVSSDAVDFSLTAFSNVAISCYLPQPSPLATYHGQGTQTIYVAAGDVSASQTLPGAETRSSYYFLTNLDVDAPEAYGSVVTLGASITDGVVSSTNANRRWPNDLAVRLADAGKPVGVLNQGISGNKLLVDGAGESALNRFERDVVLQPGVRWVILSDDPINDLGSGSPPSASELIEGAKELVAAAHAAGIQFICSTLTPFEGAGYWTPEGETGRQAYNDFVRSNESGCDAVLDQDEATHDPDKPTWYLPLFDAGDHLHPNETGLQAIADAVDLDWFEPPTTSVGGAAGSSGAGGAGGGGAGTTVQPTAGAAGTPSAAGSGGAGLAGSNDGGSTAGSAGGATIAAEGSPVSKSPGCSCESSGSRASRALGSWSLMAGLLALLACRRSRSCAGST
jgi:lysophospholipase L1-like esterase